MNHLDLFSGIGGFSLGLKQAGVEPGWIGYSDIDKHANQLFKRRFPNAKELGSITTIQPDKLPKIDLITFGFPCQDLSIAGKRGGLAANRSSLFFEAIKIIQHKKPKYFIFENVKGIFSSNGGKDFDIVLRSIADIGYDGQWELCNTRWYLPQNRERVYFVGHIRGESRPKVFPLTKDDRKIKDNGERKKIQIIDKKGLYKVHSTQTRGADRPSLTKECDCGSGKLKKKCCGASGGSGHLSREDGNTYRLDTGNTQAVEIKSIAMRTRGDKGTKERGHRIEERDDNVSNALNSVPKDYMVEISNTICTDDGASERFQTPMEELSPCLKSSRSNYKLEYTQNKETNIRRLTPTECERLQGFPDGWTDGQSDTQRYKQLGNAVSVPVVKAIMERLYKGESNAK